MNSKNYDADIVIVGAGLSGLTAAFSILERDPTITTLVLDANDRIGGRILSVPLKVASGNYESFDLGGQFLSKSQVHLWTLLNKLDVPIVDVVRDFGNMIGDFGSHKTCTTIMDPPIFGNSDQIKELSTLLAELEILSSQISLENPFRLSQSCAYDLITMQSFIHDNLNSPLSIEFMETIVRSTCGVEPSDISVLFYLVFCHSTEGIANVYTRGNGRESCIKGGAMEICSKLADAIGKDKVQINSAVTSISRTKDSVIVYTAENEYRCQYAILAIPPAQILKIIFNPALNQPKIKVLKRMSGRSFIKFVVTYKRAFWTKSFYSGDILCHNNNTKKFPIIYCLNITQGNNPALCGLLDEIDGETKPTHKAEVLNHLSCYFGEDALEPIDYAEQLWSNTDNIIDGSTMACPQPRMMQDFHHIRRPIGRLFFAGTETATYWYGHMNGAVQAGMRAAVEVIYEYRPQLLTLLDFAELKPMRRHILRYADRFTFQRDWIIMIFITTLVAYVIVKVFVVTYIIARTFF